MNAAIVILFFLAMLLIGILSARKIGGTVSYFVADRKGTVPVITGSLVATAVGGSSTIGLAGLGYTRGLVGAWWLLVGVIGLGVLAVWFVEKVRAFEVFTLPEILERQYGGQAVKIVASLLIVIAWLGIVAAQILAAGKLLSVLLPGHFSLVTSTAAMVFILYTILGGQYSILRTDGIQSVIIICGILLCFFAGISAAGGLSVMAEQLPRSFFSFPLSAEFGWFDLGSFLIVVGATYLVGPDIYSRIFCTKDADTARRALFMTALVLMCMAFCITFIGMAARVLLPEISPESALPSLIMEILPAGLNGMVIAALLAAVMSSADTVLLTAGTIIVSDIINPLFRSQLGEKRLLFLTRISIALVGAAALLIALTIKGVIASLLLGYTVYSSGLVIPVLFGFYVEKFRLNFQGVLCSVIGGGCTGLFLKLSGYDKLLFITFPLSALFLFAGSYIFPRIIAGRKGR